jgi:hypothetical protein
MARSADRSRIDTVDCLDRSASVVCPAPGENLISWFIVINYALWLVWAATSRQILISIFRILSFDVREP